VTRARFGTWGTGLLGEQFSEALAALGVLLAARRYDAGADSSALTERLAERFQRAGGLPIPWGPRGLRWPDPQSFGPAEALAHAWHEVVGGGSVEFPRLEIGVGEDPGFDEAWASTLLAGVRVRSVYLRDDRLSEDADWGWPLRLGLLRDEASVRLRGEIRSSVPWPDLYEIAEGSGGLDEVDLLLVPYDPPVALERVVRVRLPVQANCVVVFGSLAEPWPWTRPVLEALATQAEASGVVVAPVPPGSHGDWIRSLVASLAHDEPLDVAVGNAREATGPPALFLAHRRLVEVSRLMVQAERMTRRVMAADGGEAPVPVTRGLAKRTGLEVGAESGAGVAKRIRTEMRDPEAFVSELRGATTVAEFARAAEPILSPTADRNLRRILARVHDVSDPTQPREASSAFRADAQHRVEVWIGPWELGAVAASERFPEEELPPSPRGHRLTVVFTELKSAPAAQVQTLYLPRAGRSTSCEFAFRPHAEEKRVEARISVLYRNRVLQTTLLRGEILPDPALAPAGAAIRLDVEAVVRPSVGELRGRQPFDAALIFNRTADGDRALTVASGLHADFRQMAGMTDLARKMEEELTEAAKSPERYDSFDSPASLVLLRTLANQGAALRQSLIGRQPVDEALARAERIQVLAVRPEELIPLELLYDRPAPSATSGLCPNFQERVLEGRCGDDCPGGDQVPSPVVCPLAFWCANRVIERHATEEGKAPKDLRLDLRLLSEPTSDRNVLPGFASGLLGASGRVDSLGGSPQALPIQKILDALLEATGQRADRVDTWEQWRARVKERHPTLLMVLPHTLEALGVEALEIGQGAILARSHFGPDILGIEGAGSPPIVVLLGCDTALPTIPFQSFVLAFRENGAAIVLGTIAAILGRYAAPLAEELIRDLRAVASVNPAEPERGDDVGGNGADVTFGDILHEVRRKLMAKGQVMALTLTAYGDADWRLGPAEPPHSEGGGGR
jgi:hypothetical protein